MYILDVVGLGEFSELQFGFIPDGGTQMAVSLANDVISHCTSRESIVYTCSLDAEGAFDAIPHPVLFHKAMNTIPDQCWRILVYWYRMLSVHVKWGDKLSKSIKVCRSTRQGGLSSPGLF